MVTDIETTGGQATKATRPPVFKSVPKSVFKPINSHYIALFVFWYTCTI